MEKGTGEELVKGALCVSDQVAADSMVDAELTQLSRWQTTRFREVRCGMVARNVLER